jgi:hypothetical protein
MKMRPNVEISPNLVTLQQAESDCSSAKFAHPSILTTLKGCRHSNIFFTLVKFFAL